MKTLYASAAILAAVFSVAQPFPSVTGFTISPEEPTELDQVLMIAEVETPFQGHRLDRNQYVSHPDFRVDLTACYYSSSNGSPEKHIDTFYIGFLDNGYFAVSFKATLSDQPAYCHLVDSTQESTFLQVGASSGIVEWSGLQAPVFPNPCSGELHVPAATQLFRIRNVTGAEVTEGKPVLGKVNLPGLPPGMYYMDLISGDQVLRTRFIRGEDRN